MNSKLSIIIVNYNVKVLIDLCLTSIFKTGLQNIETIVVDNNSSDDSVKHIKSKFPNVILIENKFNAGFPAANNQGIAISKGEYIFLLNPDTEILENALEKMLEFMDKNNQIDMLGPQLLNTDYSLQQSVWRFPTLWSIFCQTNYLSFLNKAHIYADIDKSKQFVPDSFSGAAMFCRRNLLLELEGLDETMFWIEDVELCYRAVASKKQLIYYPEAKILHHIGQSAKKNYVISISNQIYNKIKFFKKHSTPLIKYLIILLSLYHVLLKIIIFGILSPFQKIYRLKLKAYLHTLPHIFNPPLGIL